MIKVVLLTSDAREAYREYDKTTPYFGTAPEALLQGLALWPEVEVHVISCSQRSMQAPERLAANVWFHGLLVPKIGWLRTGYQGCIRAVRNRLRAIKPDIVHGQGTERDCAISAVWSGFPNVITIHGNMSEMARVFKARPGSFAWCAALFEDFALKRTCGVFCNSEFTENLVRPRTRRTWRVPNPLRERFFTVPPPVGRSNRPVLLNVGVICANKRQLELLDLAERLHAHGHQFIFYFLGRVDRSDPYAAQFLTKMEFARNQGYAKYDGVETGVDGLIERFDQASALIHFPRVEAFGLVVAEALARGLKFFGGRCGGIVDIVDGVGDAELFETGDFAGLEGAISKWIQRSAPLPPNAASLMRERYHPRVVARRHLDIYQEVLSRDL